MKLSEVKSALEFITEIKFELPDGSFVPSHFHVTEIGEVNKKFIDCGGVMRNENSISFQLWEADDFDHRLAPGKLVDIISLSEAKLQLQDLNVEVEYQQNTIARFDLTFNGHHFVLKSKQTDCLAPDKCGIPVVKQRLNMAELGKLNTSCKPGSGCC